MTPSLVGRIHTRLILVFVIGVPVTLLFGFVWAGFRWDPILMAQLATVLVTITATGLILDPVYLFLQRRRWDRDWPFAFQFYASWVEFGLAAMLVTTGWVPLFEAGIDNTPLGLMSLHFLCVFVPSFLALLGPLQVISLRWRYNAGEFRRV